MAAGRIVLPGWMPARNPNGAPIGDAEVYVYENLTTTLATVWANEALTTPLANPVSANSSGQFPAIWAEGGTDLSPVLYTVAITADDGGTSGRPSTFDNLRPSVDAETATLILTESAASSAEASADSSQEALQEILDLAANAPDAPSVVNKANRDGGNVTSTFPETVGVERVLPVVQGLIDNPTTDALTIQATIVDGDSPVFRSPGETLLVNHPVSTGGSGSNPDDSAMLIDRNVTLTGQGTQETIYQSSQTDTYFHIFRSYILPIDDREPDLIGGGYSDLQVNGDYDTEDAGNQASWVDADSSHAIVASGIKDYTFKNLLLTQLSGYGIGFQNGRQQRKRVRDVVVDGCMNDGIDEKNNYNKNYDNLYDGVWINRFGRGTNLSFPFAGLDLMGVRQIASNLFITNFGGAGSPQAAIRMKQGELVESRGIGSYKNIVHGFHIDALETPLTPGSVYGVHSAHRRSIIALGTIEGTTGAGLRLDQERPIVVGLDMSSVGPGLWVKQDDETTFSDYALSVAVRVTNSDAGMTLERDDGVHLGFDLGNNTTHVALTGDRNFLLGQTRGTGTAITDTGTDNLAMLWRGGKLEGYRDAARRYAFGDTIEHYAAASQTVEVWTQTTDNRTITLTAPAAANGNWIYATGDQFRWDVDGVEGFAVRSAGSVAFPAANGPVLLKSYSVNQLPAASSFTGSVVYCTNGNAGSPCLAVSNGTNWLRIALGAAVSAT